MNTGRVVLVASFLVVAGLGVWFAVARWEDTNKVAAIASALGAVAAVGVAVWAALRTAPAGTTVSGTGNATADSGGHAITGVAGRADGTVHVTRTGDAKATGGGDAVTGVQLN